MSLHQLDDRVEISAQSAKGAFFMAVPDDSRVKMVADGKGGIAPVWPNSLVFPREVSASLLAKVDLIWFPPGNADALNGAPWIISNAGDADAYETALSWFCALPVAKRVPVFNNPEAVLRTRRDRISRMLQGIPDLMVPKCVRFKPSRPRDFNEVFQTEGFHYPVLVRPVGTQTGRHLVKIDGPDSWARLHAIPWGGSTMFMTQYVEFAGADARYTKIRVACVGNEHLIRHAKFSRDWRVHNDANASERVSDEMRLLDELSQSESLAKVITAIKRLVRLDYWGIDIGYQGPGKPFVFFEANASMSLIPNELRQRPQNTASNPSTPDAIRKSQIKGVVQQMLVKHLAAPQAWISGRG